jgi:hypothetical protein
MKLNVLSAIAFLLLLSCKNSPEFVISGTIDSSKGQTLYLEHVAIDKVVLLDSVVLSSDGKFSFEQKKSEFSPEFYRLRLNNGELNLCIDSTETVTVQTTAKGFGYEYTVDGSLPCKQIQALNRLSLQTKESIDSLIKLNNQKLISSEEFLLATEAKLAVYKNEATKLILSDPKSGAAYFALFQRIYSYLIFDSSLKKDLNIFGAVATSYDMYHPTNPRTIHLHEFTLQAMKALKKSNNLTVPSNKVIESTTLEIALPDLKGVVKKLSAQKGKVVVLCFTAYQTEFSPSLNMILGEIYASDHAKGVEIYQVSLDDDENFWKVSASHLPWICVRDPNGSRAIVAKTFNISQLPTIFLVDRNGDISSKNQNLKSLSAEIAKLL